MIRTEEQDKTSGMISLAISANKLQFFVAVGEAESRRFAVDKGVLAQWDMILKDSIDFYQSSGTEDAGKPPRASRFLSRAQFVEQIYCATPESNKVSSEELAKYLSSIRNSIMKVSDGKTLPEDEITHVVEFASSIADEAIRQSARFHREPHFIATTTK